MTYYEADARIMSDLAKEIEHYGMPLIIFRKFRAPIGVIENQIENEYGHSEVVETLGEGRVCSDRAQKKSYPGLDTPSRTPL